MRPLSPLYLVAEGVNRPQHIQGVAPAPLVDGVPLPCRGATYNGAAFEAMEWKDSGQGWHVAYRHESLPASTFRENAIRGHLVRGWLVPLLVDLNGVAAVGYFGPNGWTIPQKYQKQVSALLDCLDYKGEVTDAHARLAADILSLNYHVSLVELEHFQVLDRVMVSAVIFAACGVPPEAAAAVAQG